MEIRWVISLCDGCDSDHWGFGHQVLSSALLSSKKDAWSCKFLYFLTFLDVSVFSWVKKERKKERIRKKERKGESGGRAKE